jgi:hypothetical protein
MVALELTPAKHPVEVWLGHPDRPQLGARGQPVLLDQQPAERVEVDVPHARSVPATSSTRTIRRATCG